MVARGAMSSPVILARRRIELVDGSVPRQPYHAAAEDGLSARAGAALIERVEARAAAAAAAATRSVAKEFGISAVGIVGGARNLPSQLERILVSHALLHAAEGDLYEQALAEGAARTELPVHFLALKSIEIVDALDQAGKALGPPWQKDHKLAAAAALTALTPP